MRERTPRPEATLIRNARHAHGLTHAQAAAKADITEKQWADIETGQRCRRAPAETIARMAHAVGIRSETLGPLRKDAAADLEILELADRAGTPEFRDLLDRLSDRLPEPERTLVRDLDLDLEGANAELADLKRRVAEIEARTAQQRATRQLRQSRGRRLVTRYMWAGYVTAMAAVVYGLLYGFGVYHAARWIHERSAPPHVIVLAWEAPGPFSGWLNYAVWVGALVAVVTLPKQLVKAHRNKHYPEKAPSLKSREGEQPA